MATDKSFELDEVIAVTLTVNLDQEVVGPALVGGPSGDGLLQEDGASYILLEDGATFLILE